MSGETGRGGENSGESGDVTSGSDGKSHRRSAIRRNCQRYLAIVIRPKMDPTGPFNYDRRLVAT
jgi:hypothetical protein